MKVVTFPLAILSSTSNKQPFLGVEVGEWPQGVSRTQPGHSGMDGAIGDQAGAEVLSCYLLLVTMEASAPSALLRTLLWRQPSQERLTHHRMYLGPCFCATPE